MSRVGREASVAPRAGPGEWIGLAVIALPCLLYSMDLEVLNLAIPQISADLQPSSSQLLWIVDIYGFLLAGFLITMGTLGDRIGRRRLLLVGAAAFGLISVFAAFSTSAGMLIAARALLGVAGATLAPSTLSLIRNMFLDPQQRTIAIGVWAASFSAGAAIGPVVGGVLLEFFWWGSAFLIAVPVMVILLVLGPRLLPEFRDPHAGRLDLRSAVLSLVAVLAVIYGLKQVVEDGLGALPPAAILGGVVVGAVFVRRQLALADPLVDLRLFRVAAFSGSLAAITLSLFTAFGVFLFIAQYLQSVLGLSPLRAGLWSVPAASGLIAGSLLAPWFARMVRPASAMAGGLALAAVGFILLARAEGDSGLTILVPASVLIFAGIAPVGTLATDLIVGTAPPERAGAASAISETGAELGGALGVAVLGSIGGAFYRRAMVDLIPEDVPNGSAEAARETVGGAVEVASHLPRDLSFAVLDAAHAAFSRGLRAVSVVSAVILASLAVAVVVVLRGSRDVANTEPEHQTVPPDDCRQDGHRR